MITHLWFTNVLMMTRRFEQADSEIQIARSIEPLSMISLTIAGLVQYYAGRFDEAVAQFRRVLELDSRFQQAHYLAWLRAHAAETPRRGGC